MKYSLLLLSPVSPGTGRGDYFPNASKTRANSRASYPKVLSQHPVVLSGPHKHSGGLNVSPENQHAGQDERKSRFKNYSWPNLFFFLVELIGF